VEQLGWLIFLVALIVSVMLHEFGHFTTAKRFGMKATQFFVGFGPTVWSFRRGETEYGVKALPVGGFVKIIGMTSLDEVDEEDEPRSFRRQPGWQRLIVLAAGSFMHFLLAAVMIFILALTIGVETTNTPPKLMSISSCLPASATAMENGTCTASDPKSPAELAGLRAGDLVTAYDGKKVTSFTQLSSALEHTKPGSTVPITVLRDGKTLALHVTPAAVKGRSGGILGIAGESFAFQRTGVPGAVTYVGSAFAQEIVGSVQGLGQIPREVPKLFTRSSAQSGGSGVTSTVGIAEVTGQAVAANTSLENKISFIVLIVASVNIFVGVFNLVPLLPLDGGHIAVVFWELIRSRIARLRRRPDPGLVDYRKLIPVSLSVFAVLVVFGVMLMISNVINPVSIG
jgi:membrane-associated protease RseP (regulator of RpoE activity)